VSPNNTWEREGVNQCVMKIILPFLNNNLPFYAVFSQEKTGKMGKVTNIEYGNIDFEKVNFESLISTRS